MNDTLSTTMRQLRLSGMAQTLDVRLQEAAGNRLNHQEFLELILKDELMVRNSRLVERRVKAAGFRDKKTLEDFDWHFNTSVKRQQIYELATGAFIREARDCPYVRASTRRPWTPPRERPPTTAWTTRTCSLGGR